eukprot:COSAG02_NODE_557_length_20379_cov_6.688215_19_plen_539_part_00
MVACLHAPRPGNRVVIAKFDASVAGGGGGTQRRRRRAPTDGRLAKQGLMMHTAAWVLGLLVLTQRPGPCGGQGSPSLFVDDALKAFSGESQMAAAMARARRNQELSTSGGEIDLVGPDGDELQDDVIKNPSNLVFGADGSLFVASFTLDHVVRFEFMQPQQSPAARHARYSVFAAELDGPSALALDEATGGGLFVASFGGDEVLRFGPDGTLLQRYGNEEEVDCPEGLAVSDGLLYVSSWHRGWVVRYNISTGVFLGQFVVASAPPPPAPPGEKPLASSAVAFPEELAFTPDGNLVISHFYSNTLMLYGGEDGASLGPLLRGKVLRGPVGVIIGPDGYLYVGSYKRNVVLRLNPFDGAVVDVVAARGELHGVAGLAFAPDGTLYVSSYEDSRVVRFNVSEAVPHGTTATPKLKPWEAGRRRQKDSSPQLTEEDEEDKEASQRQQQIERMLYKLKQGADAEVQRTRKGKKGKSKHGKTTRPDSSEGGSLTDFEYPSAASEETADEVRLGVNRSHSAWVQAHIEDSNVTTLQPSSNSPSA